MAKLKCSEWDPLSNGVFRVTNNDKSYLALTRNKAVEWFSKNVLKLCKEKDGYLFFKEPMPASVAIFSSEEFASAANPQLSSHEVSMLRKSARKVAETKYPNMAQFLNPPGPSSLSFEVDSPAP